MTDFTSVKEIQEGVWEIVDEKGDSMFSTHCTSCKNQFFFGDLRLLKYKIICQPCKNVKNASVMEDRYEVIQPSRQSIRVYMNCKNFSVCGSRLERAQSYRKNPTCHRCRREQVRLYDELRRYA